MRYGFLILICACLFQSAAQADDEPRTVPAIDRSDSLNRTQAEVDLFHAVNRERESHGLKPVVWDGNMVLFSRKHTMRQCSSGMFHSGGGYNENVAMGQPDVPAVMNTWMHSSGHRANILNPSVTRYGGSGFRGRLGTMWTQVFGR